MTAVNRSAIAVAGRTVTSQTWLDVVSAVDYLAAGDRHGLTVADAIEEAIRWWTANQLDDSDPLEPDRAARLPWDDPDPLRTALEHLVLHLATPDHPSAITAPDALHTALQQWVARMADNYNDGHRWTHPPDRRGYPTPTPLPFDDYTDVQSPRPASAAVAYPSRDRASGCTANWADAS